MSFELFYTSVPQGLQPGSKGFCTVAQTRGIPGLLVERLEALSSYRLLFPVGSAQSALNPISWAHWRLAIGGAAYSVLSRVSSAGMDYSGRSNVFAHHVALMPPEHAPAGPAWMLAQAGLMAPRWAGEPAEYESGPRVPTGDAPPAPCHAWEAETCDAGWAGVLVEAFLRSPASPVYLICRPESDMLRLICEAVALLPIPRRWDVTFNTYFTELPAGVTCAWRCCIAGTAAEQQARESGGMIIDLTASLGPAPDSQYVQLARTGVRTAPTEAEAIAVAGEVQMRLAAPRTVAKRPVQRPAAFTRTATAGVVASHAAASETAMDDEIPIDEPPDQSWMPPASATVIEPHAEPKAGFIYRPNWKLIGGIGLLGSILLILITRSMVKADFDARLAARDAELTQAKTRIQELQDNWKDDHKAELEALSSAARADGMSHPDAAQWTEKAASDATIDGLQKELKKAKEQPAHVPAPPTVNPTPTPPVVHVPPVTPATKPAVPQVVPPALAAVQLAQALDVDGHYWIDPAALEKAAAASETVVLLKLSGVDGDTPLDVVPLKPQAGIDKDLKSLPGVLRLARPLASGTSSAPLCDFFVDGGQLKLKWNKLDPTKAAGMARAAYMSYAVVSVGKYRVQFGAPRPMQLNLRELRAASSNAEPRFTEEGRKMRLALAPGSAWQVTSATDADVRLKHAPDIAIGIQLDGKRLYSTWAEQYERRTKDAQAAHAAFIEAGKTLTAAPGPENALNLEQKTRASEEKQQLLKAMESLKGALTVDVANGAALYQVSLTGEPSEKK